LDLLQHLVGALRLATREDHDAAAAERGLHDVRVRSARVAIAIFSLS
jgi:hypothetical protein